jgi:UDP-glucuronate decarboxylase
LMEIGDNLQGPVNLGNPGEFTISELAEMVLDAIPTRSKIIHMPLPTDDPRRRRPDVSRAKKLLGWTPSVPLSEGLAPTIEWFAASLRSGPSTTAFAGSVEVRAG